MNNTRNLTKSQLLAKIDDLESQLVKINSQTQLLYRLEELETQLKHFHDPEFCSSTELLGLVGEAIITYMNHPVYIESNAAKEKGRMLLAFYQNLQKHLAYIEKI